MHQEKRHHKRFSATAFLNKPVHLWPLPPYFGRALKGRLIDLSAGGIAILIDEIIPEGTFLNLKMTFPDQTVIESIVNAKHVIPRGKHFIHGFEFLTLAPTIGAKIDRMSNDYIDCETRIRNKSSEVCRSDCAFFSLCNKKEKLDLIIEMDSTIDMAFNKVKSPATEIAEQPIPHDPFHSPHT